MDNKTIMKKTIQKNPYAEKGKGKGMDTAQWLVDKNIDILGTAKQIGKKGPGYVFSDAGVHVMTVEEENMKDALEIVLSRI
jgi:predicted Fe-Mo cluster-binding NifX family protein